MDFEIRVNRAILHILDTNAGMVVLSDVLLGLPIGIQEYLNKHIIKAFKDSDIKRTRFSEPESEFCKLVRNYTSDHETFISVSQGIATILYDFMFENVTVPSADLMVIDFICNGEIYLGILKMNYKHSYIHFVDHEDGHLNDILRQPCSLPTENQRLDEFILVHLPTEQILLKEKKYEINEKKEYYLSNHILGCEDVLSEKQTFDIIEKTVKQIIVDEYNGDVEKLGTAKRAIADDYDAGQELDLENIAEMTFGVDTLVKERFREAVEKKGLVQAKVPVSANLESKIFKKQKFTTDSGIELSMPTEYLMREDMIVFKNNLDGTISVEIKNIEGLKSK
ncbi:MAG: nucleoid-associated protein [Eubacterium sp.]